MKATVYGRLLDAEGVKETVDKLYALAKEHNAKIKRISCDVQLVNDDGEEIEIADKDGSPVTYEYVFDKFEPYNG